MTKKDIIKEFTSLKGVGEAKAELLYDNGYTSLEKLKQASEKDLTQINGISESNAKELLSQLNEKSSSAPKNPEESKKEESQPAKKKEEQPKTTKTPANKPETKKQKQAASSKEDKTTEKKEPVTKKKEEPVEIIEEEDKAYVVKKKPELNTDQKHLLQIRKNIKDRTPTFLREEWFRYKRIPKNWRRPDGITSKMRRNYKYRPSKVRVGFRGPKLVRGLHSSGFEEIMVHNVNDLSQINPKTQAARISGTVGTKKRIDISKKAEELDIRILNMKV